MPGMALWVGNANSFVLFKYFWETMRSNVGSGVKPHAEDTKGDFAEEGNDKLVLLNHWSFLRFKWAALLV